MPGAFRQRSIFTDFYRRLTEISELHYTPVTITGILAMEGYEIPGEVYAWTAVLILPINSALNPFLYTLSAIIAAKVKQSRHQIRKLLENQISLNLILASCTLHHWMFMVGLLGSL